MSPSNAASISRTVGTGIVCNRCEQELPLRLASPGEHGAVWQCVRCGIPFPAICLPQRLPSLSSRVALDDRYFDTSYLPPIHKEARAEIIALAADEQDDFEPQRRRSPRIAVALLAAGVELDETFFPISPTLQVLVTNISAEGIGMVNTNPVSAPYLACKLRSSFRAEPIQVVIAVKRQRDLRGRYTEIGGEFVLRLGSQAK